MEEPASEKVLTAPITSHETLVDMTRKKTSASKTSSQRTEGATSRPDSRTRTQDGHLPAGSAERVGRGDEHTREHHSHRQKHRQREHSSRQEERRHKSQKHSHGSPSLRMTSPEALPQAGFGPGEVDPDFFEDRKGDQYNLTYGSLHRYSIPRYRTAGYRRVVGLSRTHKILQSSEGNTRILTEDQKDSDVRVKAHSLLVGHVDKKTPSVRVVPDATAIQTRDAELQRDFLAFDAHGRRKRRRIEAQESFHVAAHDRSSASQQKSGERDILSQRRNLSESDSAESHSDSRSDSSQDDSFDRFRKDARQQKTLELSRAVHDRPQDIEAWLTLIRHQDVVLDEKDGTTRAPTNAEKFALADVKISIYETALSKNASNLERDRLIIGLMEEGSKIWDAKKLANQWRSVLQENPVFSNLWIKYLDFQQSNFLTFTYDQCKSVYAKCLNIAATQSPGRNRDQLRIFLFLRLTVFMKDAGYSEHAVGAWQALLEYNYFHPDVLEGQTRMSLFEDFWNGEVARIGEESARGWRNGSSLEVALTSDTSNLVVDPAHIFRSWPDCEQERSLNASLPARTLDEVDDDDPYRVIISTDVSEYLFPITEPESKVLLLNAFLCFCNLPTLHGRASEQHWWTNSFLRSPDLSLICTPSDSIAQQNVLTASSVTNFVTDTFTMFTDCEYWFSCWQDSSSSNSRTSNFQKLALRQLIDGLPKIDQFAEYVIAHQLKDDAKEARKIAKALLKQRPSNLRLYNAYALIECRLGNFEAAERVWSTALSMSSTFAESDRQDAILLWRTWIWQLLDRAGRAKAFALLLAIPEGQVDIDKLSQQSLSITNDVHSTVILKARRTFESNLAQAISLEQADLTYHYADLLALLAYFTSTNSLTAALAVYSSIVSPPASTSSTTNQTTLALLHQSRARLLHHHTHINTSPQSRNSFRPAQITTPLAQSLALFPSNSIFLTLYHTQTAHTLPLDRIRTVLPALHSASHSPAAVDSMIPPIYDIWSEMRRPSYAGSTRHSIRAAFERAVAPGAAGTHSMAIWQWYLHWELSVSTGKDTTTLSRPQDIFYRGMRACPWAKEFYMLAFTETRLRDAIGFSGLRRIYETMVEKGLRIHVDLSEVLEDWDDKHREEGGKGS